GGEGTNVGPVGYNVRGESGNTGTCLANPGGENDAPFLYDGTSLVADGLGKYYLDVPNTDYFNRLYNVIAYANTKNIVVEVTLFSPLSGTLGLGPWSSRHAYL